MAQRRNILSGIDVGRRKTVGDGLESKRRKTVESGGASGVEETTVVEVCVDEGDVEAVGMEKLG